MLPLADSVSEDAASRRMSADLSQSCLLDWYADSNTAKGEMFHRHIENSPVMFHDRYWSGTPICLEHPYCNTFALSAYIAFCRVATPVWHTFDQCSISSYLEALSSQGKYAKTKGPIFQSLFICAYNDNETALMQISFANVIVFECWTPIYVYTFLNLVESIMFCNFICFWTMWTSFAWLGTAKYIDMYKLVSPCNLYLLFLGPSM